MIKFKLGRVVGTPAAIKLLDNHEVPISGLLSRHVEGDWGDVSDEDKALNDEAVKYDDPYGSVSSQEQQRVLSSYTVGDGEKVWIITEWDRSVTTILIPDEY